MEIMESDKKDEQLASLVQSGKSEFFGVLIRRYDDKMMRYASKFLSDHEDKKDIIQNVFIKAYINIRSFDTKRKFSSWLYRIAHNELVNYLKRKNKNFLPLLDLDTFFPRQNFNNNHIDEKIDRENMAKLINKHVDELQPKYKEPIVLYYLEELSYKEIADIMSIPVSTVGIRIKRAKKIMKSVFQKRGYIYE